MLYLFHNTNLFSDCFGEIYSVWSN